MLNMPEVLETNTMIDRDLLDVRTITMGLSLLGCIDSDKTKLNRNIYELICRRAGKLVETGEAISREYGRLWTARQRKAASTLAAVTRPWLQRV